MFLVTRTSRAMALAGLSALMLIAVADAQQRPASKPAAAPPRAATPAQINQRGHVNNMCEAQRMLQQIVAQRGGQRTVGDYKVVYITDVPKGWYAPSGGRLVWRAPARGENIHLEAAVLDSLTGQMLTVTPTLDVIDSRGRVVQTKQLMPLWHPMINHYGANYSIPAAGTYTIRVRAPVPPIMRHDKKLGNRFARPVDVQFAGVRLAPKSVPASEMASAPPAGGMAVQGAGMGAGAEAAPPETPAAGDASCPK